MPARSALLAVAIVSASRCGTGCAEPSPQLGWRFTFGQAELGPRLHFVEAEVLAGGCGGLPVFATRVTRDGSGATPGRLEPGRYGFRGRAQDTSCIWFAEGCHEETLPRGGAVEVVLNESASPLRDPGCTPLPPALSGPELRDAAAPPAPGEPALTPEDASSAEELAPTRPSDATIPTPGAMPEAAAPAEPVDPAAPKCRELDDAVVACFDFDGSLEDHSGRGNHAAGLGVGFEPGRSGLALRVGGTRVAVADAPSLNFATFTVELWLRSDALTNLSDASDPRSVLVDKNGQYLLAYESTGALRSQLHRRDAGFEVTTSDPSGGVVAGMWTYLAYAYDGSAIFFYKDGDRVDSRNVAVTLSRGDGAALHIGSGSPDTTLGFDGLIDALRISNVARSDRQLCAAAGKRLVGGRCE